MRTLVAVATGAVVGATLRWAAGELLAVDGFPWATLLVNLLGCAGAGIAAVRLDRRSDAWYFVVTGVLGGLTTTSAFAVETRRLLDDGRLVLASTYVAASVIGGLVAVSTARTLSTRSAASGRRATP